jgi:cephalosporin-C deacetylase-like acetyl esterase
MAIEAAREYEAIDPQAVVIAGGSQGGGIALVAGALESTALAALIDVPFLSHFARAIDITDESRMWSFGTSWRFIATGWETSSARSRTSTA